MVDSWDWVKRVSGRGKGSGYKYRVKVRAKKGQGEHKEKERSSAIKRKVHRRWQVRRRDMERIKVEKWEIKIYKNVVTRHTLSQIVF